MSEAKYRSGFRSKYSLTAHTIFVTKYRRRCITQPMLNRLSDVADSVLSKWNSSVVEFSGESDHIHLLIDYPPQKTLSSLIANLKSTMSKTMWRENEAHLKRFYWKEKRVFWTGAYFVASCGGVTVEQLKAYIESHERPA